LDYCCQKEAFNLAIFDFKDNMENLFKDRIKIALKELLPFILDIPVSFCLMPIVPYMYNAFSLKKLSVI
jgi:hypothetical protein